MKSEARKQLEAVVADRAPKSTIGMALAEWVAEQIEGQCVYGFEHFIERAEDEIPGLTALNNNMPWDMSDEFTGPFDDKAFCCETCDWWCSTDELNNEGSASLCDDCNEEE